MRSYVVLFHVGFGDIRFGMSRSDVFDLLGPPEYLQPPDPFVGDSVCFYDGSSLAILIDQANTVGAIESRGCPFIVEGTDLRGLGWSELTRFISALDPATEIDESKSSITSRHLALAANTADDETPQGILAFQPGYYDRPRNDKIDMAAWFERIARERQS